MVDPVPIVVVAGGGGEGKVKKSCGSGWDPSRSGNGVSGGLPCDKGDNLVI